MLPILPNHRTIESEHGPMLYSLYSTRCVVLLSNWTFLLRKPVRFTVPRPQQYNMIDFEQKLDRLKVVVESIESFQLKLDVEKVEYMAIQLYYHDLDSARVVEHLPFENPPFVNLIDRQKKDVEDRKAIWKKFSDVYLSRLVAVNLQSNDSGYNYDSYLERLSKDTKINILSRPPLPESNRPALSPSLGNITIWVTYVVWDNVSIAFSVEYDGSLDGVRDYIIEVADARERNLHVLVGTHDRTSSAREVGEDLIRR